MQRRIHWQHWKQQKLINLQIANVARAHTTKLTYLYLHIHKNMWRVLFHKLIKVYPCRSETHWWISFDDYLTCFELCVCVGFIVLVL